MLFHKYFPELGLIGVKAWDPFDGDQMIVSGLKIIEELGREALWLPVVYDMRDVTLSKQNALAYRRFFRKRRSITTERTDNPVAYVVRDEVGYGMLRMYCAYAEIADVRSESRAHISYDLDEAFGWIAAFLPDFREADLGTVRAEIERWQPDEVELTA